MKILISGATGYIGTNLVKRLLKDGHSLSAIVRPSTDTSKLDKLVRTFVYDGSYEALGAFMKSEKFDGVIHLATLYVASHEPKDVLPMLEANVAFGTSLLDAASRAGVRWFINTSTQAQHFDDKPYSPLNLYAATKQAFEDIVKYYSEATDTRIATLEIFETYGPKDPRPKVLNIWRKAIKTKERMDFPPGMQVVDMCHIEDTVEAFVRTVELLSKDEKGSLSGKKFSLMSENRVTLRKLAELFEKASRGKLGIKWGAKEYGKQTIMKPWSKGAKLPGWKAKIDLEEGLKTLDE